jgi:hypothetical protein
MSLLLLGTAQALASGISIIQNLNSAQKARKEAAVYGQQLQNIKETNTLLGLRAPDISGLQAQQTAAQTAQATQAIQGMGPEGAAQVANIYQAGLQQNAENMQRQAEANFQTDLAKKQNEQQVQYRNVNAQRDLATSRLEGAQQAASDRYNAGIAGVTGAVSGLGNAVAGLATSSQFDYGLDAFKRQQLAKKGYNSEEIDQLIAAGLKG